MKSPQKEPSHPGWGWGCNERTSSAGRLCAPRTSTGFLPVTCAHTPQAALHQATPPTKPHRPPSRTAHQAAPPTNTQPISRCHDGWRPLAPWAASRFRLADPRPRCPLCGPHPARCAQRPTRRAVSCPWSGHLPCGPGLDPATDSRTRLRCSAEQRGATNPHDLSGLLLWTNSLDAVPALAADDVTSGNLRWKGAASPGLDAGRAAIWRPAFFRVSPPAHSPLADWKCKPRAKSGVPLKIGVPCRECR
jgi:hypothetical protein